MYNLKNVLLIILDCVLVMNLLISCKDYHRNGSHAEIPNSAIREGEKLAQQYCQGCHMLPDPSLLDATTWEEGVLPAMAPNLGIFKHLYHKYPSGKKDPNLDSNFYPSKPLLTPGDWQNIINYYIATSPDSLKHTEPDSSVVQGLPGFQAISNSFRVASPTCSYLKIDTASHTLLLADLFTRHLYRFDSKLDVLDSVPTKTAVVDIEFSSNKMLLCNIGEINPNNKKLGTANFISISKDGKMNADTTALLFNLARPVQIAAADFNNDGITDYLVCEFGFLQGSLSLFTGEQNNNYSKKVLSSVPGAEQAYIRDYNNDGLPDIWVLFAQGDEGIFLFTNKGNGQFQRQKIMQFPPAYGSTFFELVDINKDGYPDIVYTCGDNADYSQVLKPYHGIYIYLNDGKNNFSQQYFYHKNGCYKALARDYDDDGDLDIAAISFFPDYNKSKEDGFLYLKNEGNYSFKPYSLPGSRTGRWLTMDAGDLDADGKTDLVLGNFSYGMVAKQATDDRVQGASFLLLKNISK